MSAVLEVDGAEYDFRLRGVAMIFDETYKRALAKRSWKEALFFPVNR